MSYIPIPTDEEEDPIALRDSHHIWRILVPRKSTIYLLICLVVPLVIWNIKIDELSQSATQTFAIFFGVMLALTITSIPISVVTAIGLVFMVMFQTLECETKLKQSIECKRCGQVVSGIFYDCDAFADGFKTALNGYSQPIVWMIFGAFHLGKAIEKSNLGERISLIMIRYLGKTMLGLGAAVFLSEFALAPFVPSNTARGGGIILPIVMSLIHSLDSSPTPNRNIARFLILCGAHSNLLISSIFLTGAAPNPIVAHAAKQVLNVDFTFTKWFLGAIFPAAFCSVMLIIYFMSLESPSYDSNFVMERAVQRMQDLGPMSTNELKLLAILTTSLLLWTTSSITHLSESLVAYMAFVTVIATKVLDWVDITSNQKAWDTYFWLSGMLLMAEQLSKLGFAKYFGNVCATMVQSMTSNPTISLILFGFCYFVSMYFFSSITGHAVALCESFMTGSLRGKASPYQATCLFAYYSSLGACLTPFSTGSVALYFSQGYFSQKEWFRIGIVVASIYLAVYSTLGMGWWYMIGYNTTATALME
jgi:divalent anion:Na+ symporter, DASS family